MKIVLCLLCMLTLELAFGGGYGPAVDPGNAIATATRTAWLFLAEIFLARNDLLWRSFIKEQAYLRWERVSASWEQSSSFPPLSIPFQQYVLCRRTPR